MVEQAEEIKIESQRNQDNPDEQARIEAENKLVHYVAGVMEKAERDAAEIKERAKKDTDKESSIIIAVANDMAKRIIAKAESDAKEEAKRMTEEEVAKIISKAREEARNIVYVAKRLAGTQYKRDTGINTLNIGSKYQQDQNASEDDLESDEEQLAESLNTPVDEISDSDNDLQEFSIGDDSMITESNIRNQELRSSLITENTRMYSGRMKICIPIPIAYTELATLQKQLLNVEGLRLESVGGSASGETNINVVLEEPLPLVNILADIPSVRYVFDEREDVIVLLEPSSP